MDEAKKATKFIKNISFPSTYFLIVLDVMIPLIFTIIFSDISFMVLFAIPSLISILFVLFFSEVKLRHDTIINVISTILECAIFSIGIILKEPLIALAIAYAFTYIFRATLFRVLGATMRKALSLSSLRLFIAFIMFGMFRIGNITYVWERILLMILLFTFLFLTLVELLSQPFKKTVGINPFDIVFAFFEDWLNGTNNMEKALLKISEDGKAIVNVINFFNEKGIKGTIIVPYIHPGPFGNIGSSNMPKIFHDNIKNSLCFHGSCLHELNLIQNKDVYALANEINAVINEVNKKIKNNVKDIDCASAKFLIYNEKISVIDINNKKIAIYDGDGDIDIGIGLASCDVFVDMHSSGIDDFYIMPSSLRGMNIIEDTKNAITKLQNFDYKKLKVGISKCVINYLDNKNNKISVDVNVAYLEAYEKFLFILFDSNNMKNREILNNKNLNLSEDIKIFPCTTDNHYKDNGKFTLEFQERFLEEISKSVKDAIDNAEYVSADIKRIEKNFKVMGKGAELLPTANFAVIILKFLLPFLIFIASFFIIFVIVMWG